MTEWKQELKAACDGLAADASARSRAAEAFADEATVGVEGNEICDQILCLAEMVIEAAFAAEWQADVDDLTWEVEHVLGRLEPVDVECALIFADRHGTIARHFGRNGTAATFDQIHAMALAALDDAMMAAIEPLIQCLASPPALTEEPRPGRGRSGNAGVADCSTRGSG